MTVCQIRIILCFANLSLPYTNIACSWISCLENAIVTKKSNFQQTHRVCCSNVGKIIVEMAYIRFLEDCLGLNTATRRSALHPTWSFEEVSRHITTVGTSPRKFVDCNVLPKKKWH
mmetsp:Transcript_13248/g.40823  ORF Transcript_13248/g.40823 Transcript_13248/m.40823 type:complete len:116 (-) Transcript_13248:1663-2010(-)